MSWLRGDGVVALPAAPGTDLQVRDDPGGGGVTPPPRAAGPVLTPDRAVGIIAVYRAVQLLATAVSQLTVDGYRGSKAMSRTPLLLAQPEIDTPLSTTLARTVTSMALRGNAFWRLFRGDDGSVTNVEVLNPGAMVVERHPQTGVLTYRYSGYVGGEKEFTSRDVAHLKLLDLPGTLCGLGPIQAARQELQGQLDLVGYASGWFGGGQSAIPTGLLTSDETLSPVQAAQYKAAWIEAQQQREVAVLGKGLAYSPILMSPEDALFVEQRKLDTAAVARLFGVPAHLMLAAVEGSNLTYSTLRDQRSDFVSFTLQAYTRPIEAALSSFLPQRNQTARVNFDAFLRADTAQRYAALGAAIASGLLTVDEARAIEGLAPLTDPTTDPSAGEQP